MQLELTQQTLLGATIACGAVGLVLVAALTAWSWRRAAGPRRPRRGGPLVEMACTQCRRPLSIAAADLTVLPANEVGLVARTVPEAAGRHLVEYTCPHCGATHCFAREKRMVAWLGANLLQPGVRGAVCRQCRKPLQRPPWPPGPLPRPAHRMPDLRADHGLTCPRCGAVVCVECVKGVSRGRSADGSFLCPRCFRGPLTTLFYP